MTEQTATPAVVIATHDGSCHADDVFGVSVLRALHPGAQLLRTRNPGLIASADFVVDVGGTWDEGRGRFDHHQRGFDGRRPTLDEGGAGKACGVGYASAGLVWRAWGHAYVDAVARAHQLTIEQEEIEKIAQEVDENLVQYLDLEDNGKAHVAPGYFGLSTLLAQLNSNWLQEQGLDARQKAQLQLERFDRACEITGDFLRNIVLRRLSQPLAAAIVRQGERLMDGQVLYLPRGGMPWTKVVLEEMPQVMFVVYPDGEGGKHMVHTVPLEPGSFESRLDLVSAWAGLRDEELAQASGIPDALFCHLNLFIGAAGSREGALHMARLSLEASV